MVERYTPFATELLKSFPRHVSEHPLIIVKALGGGALGGGVDHEGYPAEGLSFLGIDITLTDDEAKKAHGDTLRFYIAETPNARGMMDEIALVVGTRKTGPRMVLQYHGLRDSSSSGLGVAYRYYPYWRKLNGKDDKIKIQSRTKNEQPHILDNSKDGGYYSPHSLNLNLQPDGTILLQSLTGY